VDAYYIGWSRVISSIPGNPLLIFQGTKGLSHTSSDGGFSWVNVDASNPFDLNLAAQGAFYEAAQQKTGSVAVGSVYKGFNDTLATWGTNRVTNQQCGQAWQQTFSEAGKFYSSGDQLPAIQIATWNDYEEGTAIEPGIDNCIYLAPSQSGATIGWSVNGGDEDTIDHYTVFISTDGTNLAKLGDVPTGTHAFDLGPLKLPDGTYLVYIKATGAPSFQNKMSPAMAYHPGDQPPDVALNISQTGPLAYMATAAASSGTIARSVIDFGDGTVITGLSAAHTYKTVGTYLITASEYDAAGASTVVVHQISAKPSVDGITVFAPGAGSTVNWPTMLVASANPGTPVSVMRVLVDGQQAYATAGDTLNTAIKIFTGSHQISVQSFDQAGNQTASTSFSVRAEPDDLSPVARIDVQPMPNISPTTVLGCTATSSDPDGFLISRQMQYSDGSHFSTPAALETLPAMGSYTATLTVMDQFGATTTTSTTFSVDASGKTAVVRSVALPQAVQPGQKRPLQPIDLP
jgi:phage baseplate assembly protein gpV